MVNLPRAIKPALISLFCGVGGSSLGYELAGYKVKLCVDWWDEALEWHRKNSRVPVLKADLTALTGKDLLREAGLKKGELDVLDGSPPCQGFSRQNRFSTVFDPQNCLPIHWARLVLETKPRAAIMENVQGMARPATLFILGMVSKTLREGGYKLVAGIINSADYGVAQDRRRLYIIALRDGEPSLPPPTAERRLTFQEAVATLAAPGPEENHHIYASQVINALEPKKAKWKSDRRVRAFSPVHTVTTDEKKLLHPSEMRKLTIPELLRVSGFPDHFKLPSDRELAVRLLGNAVPPPMARAVGEHLLTMLRS